ncbi:dynein assembly factor 4, axonemal-like [Acanthaster planci]|uniref:Dynein axonemal assembly factor 4 n=1 Tax=Acanthaster planci TaxID=133434 RepID=A0A8B7YXI0_ACAPL|nr:dynein assembly factor 4, axonemal-like [Acanthaster planci]
MPITVRDYTWDETETSVHVDVPLKGVKASKVDIFSTDEYLKVNFPPYLFEVVLFQPVDDSKGTAQVGDGTITFSLQKRQPGLWNRLISPNSDDKELMKSKRQAAIDAAHRKAQQEKQQQQEEKRERDRTALKEQMRLENEERQRIESIKEAERQKATEDFEKWKAEQLEAEKEREETQGKNDVGIFDDEEALPTIGTRPGSKDEKPAEVKSQPPPRSSGNIQVRFTPRVFPTPLRESKVEAEEEWLRKQAEARRVVDVDDPDLTEEEKNPVWLKDKGDGFFKSGNYLAAVNAYNLAVRLDSKLPSVYSNRATCHLKLRNFIKCIEDCSKALDLLTPPVEANAKSRLRAHVKRGTAFCELELYVEGLQDYEAALKLDPKNAQLIVDTKKIRAVIQSTVE